MRAASLLLLVLLAPPHATAATLTYRGCRAIEDPSVRGLSGITYGGEARYYAVADNSDRVFPVTITLKRDASIDAIELQTPYRLGQRRDFEGVAMSGTRDTLFISDESPAVGDFILPGMRRTRTLPLPEVFKHVVPNQGLESLTCSPDGRTLWTANERALVVDGNPQTPAAPLMSVTRVRLLRYDLSGDEPRPAEQFEYQTSGVHDWGGQIGLCDLAALPDGRLLALERSAAMDAQKVASIRTRIFLVDTTGADDVSDIASLTDRPPGGGVKKTLLYDGFVCGARGANLEGLCLGPALGENRWAVIGVVDSTDGGLGLSRSTVVSFELDLNAAAMTAPATAATTPAAATKTR